MKNKAISSSEAIRNKETQCQRVWEKALDFFETYFIDKKVIYEYKENMRSKHISQVTIEFEKSNFLHLCGLQVDKHQPKNIRPTMFWKEIVNKRFNSNHWQLSDEIMALGSDPKRYFTWKTAALISINELLSTKVCLTKAQRYDHLVFDIMVRSHKETIGLALKKTNQFYRIISTINLSSQLSNKAASLQKMPVTSVYSLDRNGNKKLLLQNSTVSAQKNL
ncbi:hypothetical protein DLJ48_01640 [Oenococcus sicerae]|uniref:Phage-Barnase-EndoU-ColicinE5/D-RelE like nuclease 4 domain-containing protein n=1 Tax=Oenococcus sicerae TaxID=2203724 RepID=A0ABX5QKM3_9LACO|nr:PBECR4 domain-containing protein [Oenococcus sicerae]QAS69318.1 hypothetical protein DLJ48_01640 [Oenococcus sicerae]